MRLIDADAAIDAVLELNVEHRVSWVDAVIDMLDGMPTAEPKKGKWLPDNNDYEHLYYYCSNCQRATQIPRYVGGFLYDFCPNCGADMRGEQDE